MGNDKAEHVLLFHRKESSALTVDRQFSLSSFHSLQWHRCHLFYLLWLSDGFGVLCVTSPVMSPSLLEVWCRAGGPLVLQLFFFLFFVFSWPVNVVIAWGLGVLWLSLHCSTAVPDVVSAEQFPDTVDIWEICFWLLWSSKFINNHEAPAIFNKSWLADLFQKIYIAVNNTIYI